MGEWRKVTKASPCPICAKADWCSRSADGAVRCMRIGDAPLGWRTLKQCADGGVVFRRKDDRPTHHRQARRLRPKATLTQDWPALAQRYAEALTEDRLHELTRALGVHPDGLRSIAVGWTGSAYTFPERDSKGRIIGIATRWPDGSKRFLPGGKRGLMIPDHLAELPDPVLSVEGPTDTTACLTMGLTAVGRPSNRGGVDHLGELLRGREVFVVGENDRKVEDSKESWPGRDGARSVAKQLAERWGKPMPWALPPGGVKDIRAWLNARNLDLSDRAACEAAGRELLDALGNEAQRASPMSFRVDRTIGRVKVSVTALFDGRPIAVETFDLASSAARERFAKAIVAEASDLDIKGIKAELIRLAVEPPAVKADDDAPRSRDDLLGEHDELVERELAAMPSGVVRDAEVMLTDPRLVDHILADIAALGVVGERVLALAIYLLGVSRLLEKPLAAIVQGPTSSGKSFVIERVARLFPDEATLIATDITPMALYYLPTGRLIHRWVVAGERSRIQDDERAEAARALREMLSSGELRKAVPVKIDGQMQTVVIHQPGPIAYVESTTATRIFDEDANRSLLLSTDESPEQTRRIVAAVATNAQEVSTDTAPIVARHHAMQRMLRRVHVLIPFAKRLAAAMPSERPEARRAIGHALSLIRAVAVLHQRQRASGTIQHGDTIQATIADYVVARRLLCAPLGRALGGAVPEAAANLGKRLADHYAGEPFTTSEAVRSDPIVRSRGKMSEYLRTLADAGVVELVDAGKGNKPHIWRVVSEVPEGGARWLPAADELEPSLCTTA